MNSHPVYCAAYAQWAPIMRARWAKSRAPLAAAKADILDTLELYKDGSNPAYVGKLYAELDAIRDREHSIRREGRRVAGRPVSKVPGHYVEDENTNDLQDLAPYRALAGVL